MSSESFTATGSVQYYSPPVTGPYVITVEGAQGGGGAGWEWSDPGGKGAVVSGEFELTVGQTFVVVVGAHGGAGSYYGAGGGGGSFVFEEITSNEWGRVISAGGGGGAGYNSPGGPGQAGQAGHAGYDGGGAGGGFGEPGGGGGAYGGGGGGYSGGTAAGGYYGYYGYAGYGIGNATFKGGPGYPGAGGGGFGGGGGGSFGGGGGGGFAGGGGGGKPGLSLNSGGGGGGGSYDAGANPVYETGANTGNGEVIFELVCFASGTRIATSLGEVPVEALKIGERLILAGGGEAAVKWLGHRRVDCDRHPDPAAAWPVRVSAGALGEGLPVRDLWLSPRHALLVEAALIPVERLINGVTIVQEPRSSVEYWHVELEAHEAILAEGLPVESYLDLGNRGMFANAEVVELRAFHEPRRADQAFWPYVEDGPTLVRARRTVHARALALGFALVRDARPFILADGQRIEATRLSGRRFSFLVPAHAPEVRLGSMSFAPCETDPENLDDRRLGLCVARLELDGRALALDDPELGGGWHWPEDGHRWTTGLAALPPGAEAVIVELAGEGRYWGAPAAVAPAGMRQAARS